MVPALLDQDEIPAIDEVLEALVEAVPMDAGLLDDALPARSNISAVSA
ncbi:MAG: hypothetical protein L0G54_14650 [Brevibacterium sp.]|nr:hypothetical protein [Brevibacterium sp.]